MSRDDPWDRPSFDMNVRPEIAVRNVGRKDIIIPRGPSGLRMLAMTFVAGCCMALLYVWPPLMIVVLATTLGVASPYIWGSTAFAALVFWALLYRLAVHESAADRRYAEQLHLPG